MAVIVDTDVLIELERNRDSIDLLTVAPGEDKAISVISISELLQGVHRSTGSRRIKRSAFVDGLLSRIEPVEINDHVARVHSLLWAEIHAQGKTVGSHDLWIAATAFAYGYGVVTQNVREFSRVPGLRLVPIN